MKFTNMIAAVAIFSLAASANAQGDGTLRRRVVAQNDVADQRDVNININTNTASQSQQGQQQAASAQPVTVVEASPVVESKAEVMRRARQQAEVNTEQKIVEKLEDSRLQEERARADRLFGNKMDAPPAAAPAPAPAPVVAPVVAPAPAPVVVQEKPAPAQVTIEKVEIIQPKAEPVAETKAQAKEEASEPAKQKYYINGLIGNLSYAATNVKSNYGLGVAVGTIIDNKWGVELSYMYSNHNIEDLWQWQVYHKLDQTDLSGAAKFYFLPGSLKPYVGGSVSYINRKYTDRIYQSAMPGNNYSSTESTQAVNMGILGGVDFALSESFMLGAGVDYNFNVLNVSSFNERAYSLPAGSTELEKISFYTLKVNAKFLF